LKRLHRLTKKIECAGDVTRLFLCILIRRIRIWPQNCSLQFAGNCWKWLLKIRKIVKTVWDPRSILETNSVPKYKSVLTLMRTMSSDTLRFHPHTLMPPCKAARLHWFRYDSGSKTNHSTHPLSGQLLLFQTTVAFLGNKF